MMKKVLFLSIFLISPLLFFSSCDSGMVYDDYQHIDHGSWKWEDKLDFSFEIEDTLSINNILIHLRHSTDYPLSNLYMFVHLEGPSGQQQTDTINFKLAEISGKWIGKGTGNIREIGYLYRKNIRFPETGEFKISVEQAMRLPEVPVSEVGLRVEKIKH